MAVMICMTSFSFTAFADSESAADEILQTEAEKYELPEITYVKQKTYSDYYSEISDKVRPRDEVFLQYSSCSDDAKVEVGRYEGKDDVVIWSNEDGTLDFTVDVTTAGAYNMEVCYYPITGGNTTSEMSVLIDGETPFDTAMRVSFPRTWKSAYEIATSVETKPVLLRSRNLCG